MFDQIKKVHTLLLGTKKFMIQNVLIDISERIQYVTAIAFFVTSMLVKLV